MFQCRNEFCKYEWIQLILIKFYFDYDHQTDAKFVDEMRSDNCWC